MRRLALLVIMVLGLSLPVAGAEDAFYSVRVRDLPLAGGKLPAEKPGAAYDWRLRTTQPWVILDGEGEAFVRVGEGGAEAWWRGLDYVLDNATVSVRAKAGSGVTGTLCILKGDGSGAYRISFSIGTSSASPGAKAEFFRAQESYYDGLLAQGVPGAAWFRLQSKLARDAVGETPEGQEGRQPSAGGLPRETPGSLDDTYGLLTGGRAVSENLQLDRLLDGGKDADATVKVDDVRGITVAEMDFRALIEGLHVEKDALASLVPADQHAVFFPTFNAFVTTLDEADANGTPVLQALEPRSEDARTRSRYDKQLCLSPDALSRILGPQVVKSVAMTGSDPYLRVGSDVALLFEAVDAAVLKGLIGARVTAATQSGAAKAVQGDVAGVAYTGALSKDRSVSSYVAVVSNAVVVTNSLGQLDRIVAASAGKTAALANADDYVFMRSRYSKGAAGETAFLMLSDAAIRRWCSARWRIGASRRTRAAAAMADLQARALDAASPGSHAPVEPQALPVPGGDTPSVTAGVVVSRAYGSLEFMTPILELGVEKATPAEVAAYETWRDRYQQNWRRYFDPIAVRFSLTGEAAAVDVTVMPLIAGTDYSWMTNIAGSSKIRPSDGDPHDGTIAHFVTAIDRESEPIRQASGFAVGMAPNLEANPFSWIGRSVSLYADDGPYWKECAAAEDSEAFLEKNFARMPVAFRAEVDNPLKLAVFLTAAHAFIDTSAPGMTTWEVLKYNETPYVKITSRESAIESTAANAPESASPAVYYAAGPDALVLTLNEDTLKASIDRARRKKASPEAGQSRPWLGESMSFRAERSFLALFENEYGRVMQRRAWANIPILNEYHRYFPAEDAVTLHERIWRVRLVCPGGGKYVWDDNWKTYKSTVYGHPGEPIKGPGWPEAVRKLSGGDFGVTFADRQLRAWAVLERKAAKTEGASTVVPVMKRP